MIEAWPEKILEAQTIHTYSRGGIEYGRVPCGEKKDDWGADHKLATTAQLSRASFTFPGVKSSSSRNAVINY